MTDSGARERALDRISELVLGDPVEFTREEAAAAAGITVEQARLYWRAMGFPDVGDRRAFTRTDVESLRLLVGWVDSGVLAQDRTVEVVRGLGQNASRLADWQVNTLGRILAESDEPLDLDALAQGMADMLPGLEVLLVHAWRRHLEAGLARGLTGADAPAEEVDLALATVGFADIAGFTRLARDLAEEELAAMVSHFETGAADIVAGLGARLVKTLGDEVMFVADGADAAVSIAAAMHDLAGPDQVALRLRIGLATGRVVTLMGDYYGETVNRASRLTAIARPGGTMIDGATEEGLLDLAAYSIRHQRPRALRGLGLVRAASIRRRDA